ncbi:ribose 5-phosphate isomerase B [Desulfoplanes sp.]
MNKAPIIIGSDHAGFPLKQELVAYLKESGYTTEDVGTHSLDSCDYPVYAQDLCKRVLDQNTLGILVCGSGVGMSMAANKVAGIRAALCTNEYLARMTRRHNNANVLCLGGRITGIDLAGAIVDAFLDNDFEGGRHQRRVDLIEPTI